MGDIRAPHLQKIRAYMLHFWGYPFNANNTLFIENSNSSAVSASLGAHMFRGVHEKIIL